jgi:hypothetical protein
MDRFGSDVGLVSLGCDTESMGEWLPTFRRDMRVVLQRGERLVCCDSLFNQADVFLANKAVKIRLSEP